MSKFSNSATIGWDIGGAHLKAVLLGADGQVINSIQLPCPLWKGLDYLQREILHALQAFKIEPYDVNKISACHAITMTGELVDLFENRHQGVCEIAKTVSDLLGEQVLFYAANIGFVRLERVSEVSASIASTNWHASASALAIHVSDALLIDIGSTTTDIIRIANSKVISESLCDASRLADDSLVYTGVVRTPVMAVAQKIPFAGAVVNVAAEYFATTADIYTLTGDLSIAENMADSADGADKSLESCARRLARMIGWDAQDAPILAWRNLAFAFKHVQLNQIRQAVTRQSSLMEDCRDLHIVGAGVGSFLVYELVRQLGFKHAPVANLISAKDEATRNMAAVCFPAYAVAALVKNNA